jgi:MerR family mercuric resistance operon transcriptional regulator
VVERICFIKRAQSVGFSLEQIKTLIELQAQINTPIGTAIASQIAEIDLKIQALQSMRGFLLAFI